jgi:spore germination cell wall hydrolase CwlJ-like protein
MGNTTLFIIALIVLVLFWGSERRVDERDYLIRTIAFEASGETEVGKVAVAHVILNRKKSGRWGDNIKAVVTHTGQFEPWMTRRKELEALSPNDPRYQRAAMIADAVLSGQTPDPTAGALGRGAAVHYRHGHVARDDPSAGTASIPLMRVMPHRSKRHCS